MPTNPRSSKPVSDERRLSQIGVQGITVTEVKGLVAKTAPSLTVAPNIKTTSFQGQGRGCVDELVEQA